MTLLLPSLRKILFFLFFFPALINAQSDDIEKQLTLSDVVILEERTNLVVSGQKSYLMDFTVEKDITYQINTEKGILFLDTILVPEPLDETYILHSPEIRKNVSSVSGLRVNRFTAETEKPDGSVKKLEPEIQIISQRIIKTSIGEANHYYYALNGLEKGDILKISYAYSFLFKENWYKLFSTRIFFHSRYPKKSFDLTLSHPAGLKIDTFLVNLEPPVFIDENDRKSYSWHRDNLAGCTHEPWSRPYKDLPNFTFSLKPYELLYEEFNSFRQEFIPLWLMLCYYRETDISVATIDNSIGAKDKDNLAYEKIAAKYKTLGGNDPSGLTALQYLQRWMVDSVKYLNSYDYYDNQENYKVHRPAVELQGGSLQDHAMEQVYANLILKLGLNFFTAYPVDKRCGEISIRFFSPMYDNDVLFAAVLKNNIISYVVPVSEKNHYYVEELPFYYEDIPVMLINSFDFGGYKVNILDSARIVKTPESLLADNTRKTISAVTVNLDSGIVAFKSALTLKGQYSTLCRPSYTGQPRDPTIDPLYHRRICDISDNVILKRNEVSATQLLFPFTTKINCEYECSDIIERTDSGYVLHINNWINHVIPGGFNAESRYTDFYPDFIGADNFTYELTFDQNIRISGANINIQQNRDFGSYSYSIIQADPNKLLLVSTLSIKHPVIGKERNSEVMEMVMAVNQRRKHDLTIEPAP